MAEELRTIKVKQDTFLKLNLLKIKNEHRNMNDLINYLLSENSLIKHTESK